MDKEKVIKWLDVCKTADRAVGIKEDYPCRKCPYKGSPRCMRELVADALALLKEQEADMIALKNAYKELAEKGSVIVRCKDCKHGRQYDTNAIDCEYRELATEPDWFCADGERK